MIQLNNALAPRKRPCRFFRLTNSWRRVLGWGAVSLALSLCAGIASGSAWTNAGLGNWFIAGNWSAGVPTATEVVFIPSGTALISSPGAVSADMQLGNNGGNGSLIISNGGTLNQAFTDAYIGALTGSNSAVTVNGFGSYWGHESLVLGGAPVQNGGSGTLRVESGARVDSDAVTFADDAATNGSATVTGAGSIWNNRFLIIGSRAAGSLAISNGGTVNTSIGGGDIGYSTGSTGSVNVTGANSLWRNHGVIQVGGPGIAANGANGNGTLQIASGGLVQAAQLQVNDTGSAQVNNGSSTVSGLTVVGGVAPPAVTSPFGALTVGNTASGRMVVQTDGTVSNSLGTIAASSGTIGSVLVHGTGSTWTNTDQVSVGHNGTGTLEVRDGGTLNSVRGFAGAGAFSTGTITVSDPGSTWTASGSFFIGNSGSGLLQVLNGGVVSTTGNSHLGFTVGATGDVNVSGAGSTLNIAVLLNIGGDSAAARGTGSVRIADGGKVTVGSATNLYNTGRLDLVNNATLTGDLNSFGGIISTIGNPNLASAVHLNAGGVSVETNNLTGVATFSGNIDGPGGLTKSTIIGITGKGTLALTGANTYTGPTTVNLGTLLVNGTNTSATTVTAGTLGGSGAISGAVTIGNNSGNDDAIIAPGASAGTLSTGNLLLNADAVFAFELDSHSDLADQIAVTGSVSINAGALFTFTDFSSCEQRPGTSLILIDNDGADPIAGMFGNLAEGAVLTSGPNTYQASYIGGTGNDLVLNVPGSPFLDADFDEDLDVDVHDLARWQTNFGIGETHIKGNADYDCDVDGADFLAWQRQLDSIMSVVDAELVPEPSTVLLFALGGAVAAGVRGLRSQAMTR